MPDNKAQAIEQAVQYALAIANDNSHGYSNVVGSNLGPVDYDCGGFISAALKQAGIIGQNQVFEPNEEYGNSWSWGTVLYPAGFQKLNFNAGSVMRGDILIKNGQHTELAISNSETVGAHWNYDGVPGDSSTCEINIGPVGTYWDYILRLTDSYDGDGGNDNESIISKLLKALTGKTTASFTPRTKSPAEEWNPCYMTNLYGAAWDKNWNTCIMGYPTQWGANALSNCVGYAQGRALEIYCEIENYNPAETRTHPFATLNCNAGEFVSRAPAAGLKVSQDPAPGAIMCWAQAGSAGHVAVVEEVIDNNTVVASESAYGNFVGGANWISHKRYRGTGNWDGDLFIMGGYEFLGFILNPASGSISKKSKYQKKEKEPIVTRDMTDEDLKQLSSRLSGYDFVFENEEITTTKTFQGLVTASGDIRRTQGAKLLSYPSLVESPFVIVRIGDYTFGTYSKSGDLRTKLNVQYPNFIERMSVQKVNGTVNQYTINLIYQIEAGRDPNLVDKILSTVGYDLIYISYGDWSCPTFVYKEEEALITNVKSEVNFSRSLIRYTISCTSNSIALAANTFNFPARKAKPSDIIWSMLYDNQYGLLDLFRGMRNRTLVRNKGLLATNDQIVEIPSKEGMDALNYLNYLVSCMSSNTSGNSILRDSTYYLTINDDTRGELGGPYFTIREVRSETKTLATNDTYEVDVGFPSDNMVTNFSIKDDNSWSLLYKYASELDNQKYVYSIDDKGHIVTRYSPNITTSTKGFITTEAQKTWWTNMTQFPITATLEIKGLLRPSMLMTYVRINAFFYGQRHISSGLYIITKQIDDISNAGYRTTLTLTRIGGDYDYISNVTKVVTTQKPKITIKKTDSFYEYVTNKKNVSSTDGSYGGSTTHVSSSGVTHGGGGFSWETNDSSSSSGRWGGSTVHTSTSGVTHGGGGFVYDTPLIDKNPAVPINETSSNKLKNTRQTK